MTPLTIQYTEEDLAEALRAHYRAAGRTRFQVVKVLVILALCIGALRVLVTGDQSIVNGAITSALAFLIIFGAAYAFNRINRSWLIPQHIRTVFAQQKELHSPTTMSWDSEGIRAETVHSTVQRPFVDYAYWLEDQGMVMLYTTDIVYFSIPARAFASDAQRGELIALLKKKGVPQR